MRRAQAMLETLIAVLVILFVFTGAHLVTRMLAARTILDHAASRAARAKAVGFNDFMCEKSARAAMIPVAGKRLWPEDIAFDEVARVPIYLESEDRSRANAVLDYEYWRTSGVDVDSGLGIAPVATASIDYSSDDFDMTASASVESHYPFYMNDEGR